jgi:hypothetical protein
LSAKSEFPEKRLLILTALVWLSFIAASLRFNNWRVTAGVVLGGALSLLNAYWLRISLKAMLDQAADTKLPRFNMALYVLRYIIIVMIVALAVWFRLVSVAATLVGLLSFAFAILLEAIIQLYFVIVNREES